jgi:hypothetical protein
VVWEDDRGDPVPYPIRRVLGPQLPLSQTIQGGQSSTTALKSSTEDEQFFEKPKGELAVANA